MKNTFFLLNIVSVTSASLSMVPSSCRSNPCGYGGTCVANLLTPVNGSYQCKCTSDRIGINCEHREYNIRIIEMIL
jgi:hypothetical protein